MEKIDRSRRNFIITLIGLCAALFFLKKFLVPRRRGKKAVLKVAKADIPANGALVYKESRLAIVRDADTISAFSLVCTHLGCTVAVTQDQLVCPCHGSVFDRRGNVVKGPADRPLDRYQVQDAGQYVHILGRS